MRPTDDIRRFIDKAAVRTNAKMDQTVLDKVLAAQEKATSEDSPALGPGRRSIVMKSSIIKLAAAAAVIAVMGLGMIEFLGTGGKSGVVWAEVAEKVEANRGFTYREKWRIVESGKPEKVWYSVQYNEGSHQRLDCSLQPEGRVFKSHYYDFEAGTYTCVDHDAKTLLRVPIGREALQLQESGWYNAKYWVRQFLSHKGTKLGRRTIDGVPCEGIEMTDPNWIGVQPQPKSFVMQLWASVQTQYPVRLEGNITMPVTQAEIVFDRFRWDVDLSPGFFEPNIPPDYKRLP